ncbi:U3 small nucleolar RNA-associated protein 14 homolog A [Astyanax mexicanus]|uniref:U3 small nucleolar RNA-associated protein 14 homolog A n=1 Tax=Astyanax mexicanus TaxID=7994 RepID=UPI0020CADFC6|nr:U3 small nucleolar RNA-associated protein 14 homolog A [Astyanax mexicanus]
MSSKSSVEAAPAVMAAEDNDEELSSLEDENVISASEDEEGSEDERKHTKLLEAISSLGGRRRMKQTERSEASLQVSEFSVAADGAGEKVELSDLLGTMEKTPGAPNKTKKQLKNLQNRKDTLELPLSKQETEKIQRGVAYKKSSREVSRWESVITQNQKAEQLVFPLRQDPTGHKRMEQVVAGWKARTPLEQEIFSLLHSNSQPIHDPVLTPVEEASIKAMSLEEAKIRRAELQKARALQSYYEAKARRESKIKSKLYHRVQKKAKRRDFLKQFEEMVKTDPDAALEELKRMELSRMQERMTLKHQNSGKWAKAKAIMAKYDHSARKAMQEQLEINKDLTQKLAVPSEDEDEEKNGDEEAGALPDFVNDPEPILDPVNPWMRGKLSKEEPEPEVEASTEARDEDLEVQQQQEEEEEEEEEEENEEEKLLREFERKRKLREDEDDDLVPVPQEEENQTLPVAGAEQASSIEVSAEDGSKITDNNDEDKDEDDKDEEEEEEEEEEAEEVVSEFNSLFNRLMKSNTTPAVPDQNEGEELLDEGLVRVQTMEDLEALRKDRTNEANQEASVPATDTPTAPESASEPPNKKKRRRKEIDLKKVLTKQATVVKVPLAPTVLEEEEEEAEVHTEQAAIIKEAFAGDDVISDFLKDKRKQEEAGRPKVVDLTLPGWGEWGGLGLKPSKNKRRKFRKKVAPPPPRQDKKLPAVIISEKRDASVAAHQVSQLPFPFQNPTQFESCVRTPIGQTWNTQTTVRKLTAPRVVTKMGAIIEPMSREDLVPKQKSNEAKRGAAILLEEKRERGKKKGSGGKRALQQKKKKMQKQKKTKE